MEPRFKPLAFETRVLLLALGAGIPGTLKPSVSTYPGCVSICATARRMPSMFMTWMPSQSMSAGGTTTTE